MQRLSRRGSCLGYNNGEGVRTLLKKMSDWLVFCTVSFMNVHAFLTEAGSISTVAPLSYVLDAYNPRAIPRASRAGMK